MSPWMDDANFPVRPDETSHGYRRYGHRKLTPCSESALERIVRDSPWLTVNLAWTPERSQLLPPIEFPSLHAACRTSRAVFAKNMLLVTGLAFLLICIASLVPFVHWQRVNEVGRLAIISALIFMFYELAIAAYDFHRSRVFAPDYVTQLAKETRYWALVSFRKVWWGYILPLSVLLTWVLQIYTPEIPSVQVAGLAKVAVKNGEWWRLVTGPFLHANTQHVLGNALLLYMFGRHVEISSPRGTVPFVLISGFVTGSTFSVLLISPDSAGASGGVFALMGYLMIFSWLNRDALPRSYFTSLLVGIGVQFSFGLFMPETIDNAAHVGGFIAGVSAAYLLAGRSRIVPYLPLMGRLSAAVFFFGLATVFTLHWYLGAGI